MLKTIVVDAITAADTIGGCSFYLATAMPPDHQTVVALASPPVCCYTEEEGGVIADIVWEQQFITAAATGSTSSLGLLTSE